MDIIPREDIFT